MTNKEIQKKHGDMFAEGWPLWFDVGQGWLPIVDSALSLIKWDVEHNKMPEVQINQIKEKFGGLRIYFDGGNERTDGIIEMATSMANRTCEVCGSNDNIGKTTGWIATLCQSCAEEEGKIERFVRDDGQPINIKEKKYSLDINNGETDLSVFEVNTIITIGTSVNIGGHKTNSYCELTNDQVKEVVEVLNNLLTK